MASGWREVCGYIGWRDVCNLDVSGTISGDEAVRGLEQTQASQPDPRQVSDKKRLAVGVCETVDGGEAPDDASLSSQHITTASL